MKGSTALLVLGVAGLSALITYAILENPDIVIEALETIMEKKKTKDGD